MAHRANKMSEMPNTLPGERDNCVDNMGSKDSVCVLVLEWTHRHGTSVFAV